MFKIFMERAFFSCKKCFCKFAPGIEQGKVQKYCKDCRRKGAGKKVSVSQLKRKADSVFSLFIRCRDKGVCFTCGVKRPEKEMQNGHFVSRTHNATRYDERNCNTQCVGCNMFKKGNMDEYALKLQRKHGPQILEELNQLKHTTRKLTVYDLNLLIEEYQQKLYALTHPDI